MYCLLASSTKAKTFCLTWNLGCGQASAGSGGVGGCIGSGLVAESGRGEAALETTEAGEAGGCGLGLDFFFAPSVEAPASAAALPSRAGRKARALPSACAPEEEGASREEGGFRPCRVSRPGRGVMTPGRGVVGVPGAAERAGADVEAEPPAAGGGNVPSWAVSRVSGRVAHVYMLTRVEMAYAICKCAERWGVQVSCMRKCMCANGSHMHMCGAHGSVQS